MSASLVLPKRFAGAARALGLRVRSIPKAHPSPPAKVGLKEDPGRPVGKPAGSYVDELSSQAKCIILCDSCQPKFDHAKHHYYKDRKFPWVSGKCDGCRVWAVQGKIYIHSSLLADSRGRIRSGQSWTPV